MTELMIYKIYCIIQYAYLLGVCVNACMCAYTDTLHLIAAYFCFDVVINILYSYCSKCEYVEHYTVRPV